MVKFLSNWFKVYEDEVQVFLWCVVLFFLIRSSSIVFSNFAETAFLKRFGVQYLPIVYMINSISTFVIMSAIAGIMTKLPGSRLLMYLLVFCGVSVGGLRFTIPLGIEVLYPLLFILKAQYEVLLGLLFWNQANDLFNTRQSKRLFPLITAGGVLGGIIGSFGTPMLAQWIYLDNLLLVYLGASLVTALGVWQMGTQFPSVFAASEEETKKVKSRSTSLDEIKKIVPIFKESALVKVLVILTLAPNVVIPILNYQFNFAADNAFASEGGMLKFFGFFKGTLNIISLILLLFVGRFYGRWGLPVALMFHPVNYMLAFMALLFRFDIFSAMYARISTNVLRTTINNPARAVLMGLFPVSYRSVIRPFLRGTVVRVGILMGSGFILLSERFLHPRYLSLFAACFVGLWIVTTFLFKRKYSEILLDLISKNMLDLKSLEERDVSQLFSDKKMREQLVESCLSAEGDDCVWYANLLKTVETQNPDKHILKAIEHQDDKTKMGLLPLLSSRAGADAVPVLMDLLDPSKPELVLAAARTAHRLSLDMPTGFYEQILDTSPYPESKAYAVMGLYRQAPERYKGLVEDWLAAEDPEQKKAGFMAAGESGDDRFIPRLRQLLPEAQETQIPAALRALKQLGDSEINEIARPYLSHASEDLRLAALESLDIQSDGDIESVVSLLDDPSEQIHDLAVKRLESADYQNPQVLIKSLTIPRRRIREGVFHVLNSLGTKDLDIYKYARSQLEKSYRNLLEAQVLGKLESGRDRDILIDHLNERKRIRLENILRVLAAQDRTGNLRIIWRGLSTADPRQRANSLEALDDMIDPTLSRLMMPLLEDLSTDQTLSVGRRSFELPRFNGDAAKLMDYLLRKEDWITAVLTLNLINVKHVEGVNPENIERLSQSQNDYVRQMAKLTLDPPPRAESQEEERMGAEITLADKIFHLRGIQIFEGLTVRELAAIASVTDEVVHSPRDMVIEEGTSGDTLYLVIKGEVSVLKGRGEENQIELDRIGVGDYFGEMALFEDTPRSASIRAEQECRFLVLHKREFAEIVREYPEIALHICRELGSRIRKLHEKIRRYEKQS